MHIFNVLPFFLIIILSNLQQTTGNDCQCECCSSQNCTPIKIGSRPLWWCSETSSCRPIDCSAWFYDRCPTRVACFLKVFVSNNTRRSIQKTDYPIWNTTRTTTPYQRPTKMPQIRIDWLIKFGLIKTTPTSTTTNIWKQRF